MKLVENGKLTIPLFHGSSTIFLNSIKKCGLGGRNIIDEFAVIDFLRVLYESCERVLGALPEWQKYQYSTKNMLEQSVFVRSGNNYRHGSVYVSSSELAAVRYAQSNKCGSEIISRALDLYSLLEEREPSAIRPLSDSPLLSLRDQSPSPILIVVKAAAVDQLLTESGEDPREQIQFIETQLTGDVLDSSRELLDSVPMSFELRQAIPVAELDLYTIDVIEDDRFSPEYVLEPV